MRIGFLWLIMMSTHVLVAQQAWDLKLLMDTKQNEINREFFQKSPTSLVFLMDENFIYLDKKSDTYERFAKVIRGFARSLPTVPFLFVVRSSVDAEMFKAQTEVNSHQMARELSIYLGFHLKNQEKTTTDAILSQIHFIQDATNQVGALFKVGELDPNISYRLIVIDSGGLPITLP